MAASGTLAVTVGLTIYAWNTKTDFTIQHGIAVNLFVCLLALLF
jgi:hypothetical protein